MPTEPFNLDQMRLLATVAAEGSFSRAAEHLGVTQSAVSQGVRAVEAALGRQLLIRRPRGLTITPDGDAYLVYARAMMRIGEEARRHFSGPSLAGRIRLGLTEDFARTVLPSVLALFSRDYPDFDFEVEIGFSTALFSGLDERRFDIVIAKRQPNRIGGDVIWSEPLAWYGRADTPCPVPDPVDLVLMPHPSVTRIAVLEALRSAGRAWRARFQCLSVATLEAVVLAGVGVTAFGLHLHGPNLTMLGEDAGLPPLGTVDMVLDRAQREADAAASAFCDLMREAALLCAARGDEASAPAASS